MNILEFLGVFLLALIGVVFLYWFFYVTKTVKEHEEEIEKIRKKLF